MIRLVKNAEKRITMTKPTKEKHVKQLAGIYNRAIHNWIQNQEFNNE